MTDPTSNERLLRIRAAIAAGGTIFADDAQWLLAQLPYETRQGPWWTPTLQVERLMRECQISLADTFTVDIKVFEGLLHDSLLWRQDRLKQNSTVETADEHPYATKRELFNAGVTHAKYRMAYNKGLEDVLANDRMISHEIAQRALDTCPEETTAPARHSRDCDCHDCHYSKKHPQIPHHALCGCFQCVSTHKADPVSVSHWGLHGVSSPPDLPTATAPAGLSEELIQRMVAHWLALQRDYPIAWEGGIDAAMEAACNEIRRLRSPAETPAVRCAVCDHIEALHDQATTASHAFMPYQKEQAAKADALELAATARAQGPTGY